MLNQLRNPLDLVGRVLIALLFLASLVIPAAPTQRWLGATP